MNFLFLLLQTEKPMNCLRLFSILLLCTFCTTIFGQGFQEEFNAVYKKFKDQSIEGASEEDQKELKELTTLMDYLNSFTSKESAIKGGVNFGFSGDATDINDLFQVNAGINLDYGKYPYQLDFSTSIQTIINNGVFRENVSNIDLSFDYHHVNAGNGLWLENYILLKRFGDNYLGIDQRYESGIGFILNYRSKKLTEKGDDIEAELDRKPVLHANGDDLIVCYEEICKRSNNLKKLSPKEIEAIALTRKIYKNANRKQYNKLRLALLAGIFYEIDQSFARNNLTINDKDTLVTALFPTLTYLRWEIRPTIEYQPSDVLKIKIHPYLKMPLGGNNQREVRFGDLVDVRDDYFIDIRTSLKAKVTRKIRLWDRISISLRQCPESRFFDRRIC